MASISVASGERGAYNKQLAANTVDTVTFADDLSAVEVWSDGSASITVLVDSGVTNPTVDGNTGWWLPAGSPSVRVIASKGGQGTTVKLISSGTPKYSVSQQSAQD
jgi:hypothetical protein